MKQRGFSTNLETQKLAVLFLVGLLFSLAIALLLSRQRTVLIRSDHFSRWYAANKLVTEKRSIYDPRNGEEVTSLNSIPYHPIEGSFFYPAHLLLLLLPFARFPYPVAHFIWLTTINIFMLASIGLVYYEVNWPTKVNQLTVIVLLSLFFIPNLQNTIWGQFNTISCASLALVYAALRRERYFLAGIFAIGFTFKPQTILLTLLFLLFWAFFLRKRWPFLVGFGLACLVSFIFAEWLEPHWLGSFLSGVKAYSNYLRPQSVLDQLGIPIWLSLSLASLFALLFSMNIRHTPYSTKFVGCIVLSLGLWWVSVPVLGMMHLVALPVAILFLHSELSKASQKLCTVSAYVFLLLYLAGIGGFLYGLSTPGLYGQHIQFAELALKVIAPVLLIFFSIPLCTGWVKPTRSISPNATVPVYPL